MELKMRVGSFFARAFSPSNYQRRWSTPKWNLQEEIPMNNLNLNGLPKYLHIADKFCQATQISSLAIVQANVTTLLPYNLTCVFTYLQRAGPNFQLRNQGINGYLAIVNEPGEDTVVVIDPSENGNNLFEWRQNKLYETNTKMYIALSSDGTVIPTSSPPPYTIQLEDPVNI